MYQSHQTPTFEFHGIRSNMLALPGSACCLPACRACQPAKRETKTALAAPSSQLRSDNEPFMLIGVYQHPISVGTLLICLGGPAFLTSAGAAENRVAVPSNSAHIQRQRPSVQFCFVGAAPFLNARQPTRVKSGSVWSLVPWKRPASNPLVCFAQPCADAPAVWFRRRRPTGLPGGNAAM